MQETGRGSCTNQHARSGLSENDSQERATAHQALHNTQVTQVNIEVRTSEIRSEQLDPISYVGIEPVPQLLDDVTSNVVRNFCSVLF